MLWLHELTGALKSLLLLFCFVPSLTAHKWGFLSSDLVGLVLSPSSLRICCSGSLSGALTDARGEGGHGSA